MIIYSETLDSLRDLARRLTKGQKRIRLELEPVSETRTICVIFAESADAPLSSSHPFLTCCL